MSLAQRRTLLLQSLVSVVALVAVVWWASRQHMPELGEGALRTIGLALALYAVATVARGERWHRVLLLIDGRSAPPDAYAVTVVGYMGNNTMPARAGDLLKCV